jgi:hypothetical protein
MLRTGFKMCRTCLHNLLNTLIVSITNQLIIFPDEPAVGQFENQHFFDAELWFSAGKN